MSRDGLPRAYLRIDPNVDQVYPEIRNTFVGLLCSGHRQPERGRYRDRRLVEALHSKSFVQRSYARGDLVDLPDGRVYIDGWDHWQEGDLTVAERMRRLRERRRTRRDGGVTETASPDRSDVTTDASSIGRGTSSGVGVGDSEPPNPPPSGGHGLRANGKSPRQVAQSRLEDEQRDRNERRRAAQAIRQRYYRGEITEGESTQLIAELDQVPA